MKHSCLNLKINQEEMPENIEFQIWFSIIEFLKSVKGAFFIFLLLREPVVPRYNEIAVKHKYLVNTLHLN